MAGGATQPSWDEIRKAAQFACNVLFASPEDGVHIQFNDERTFKREQPKGVDEAAKQAVGSIYDTPLGKKQLGLFKAGVKFQAEQGYSREAEVKEDAGGYPYINEIELYDYDNDKPLAKKGDKVIVQIRKA